MVRKAVGDGGGGVSLGGWRFWRFRNGVEI